VPIIPDGGYLDTNEADVLPFLAVHTATSRLKPCTTFVVPSARDVVVNDHIAVTGYTGMSSLHLLPWEHVVASFFRRLPATSRPRKRTAGFKRTPCAPASAPFVRLHLHRAALQRAVPQ